MEVAPSGDGASDGEDEKIDAALKAKTALEAAREHVTVAELAQRHGIYPNRI